MTDSTKSLGQILDDLNFRQTPLLKRFGLPESGLFDSLGYVPSKKFKYDLSLSSNPLGPSPYVVKALQGVDFKTLGKYPDVHSTQLRESIAAYTGMHPDQIFIGAGGLDLMANILIPCLRENEEFLAPAASFFVPKICARLARAQVKTVPMRPDFTMNLEGILEAITPKTRAVFYVIQPIPPGRKPDITRCVILLTRYLKSRPQPC